MKYLITIVAILCLFCIGSSALFAQNHSLILDSAYIVLNNGGTSSKAVYLVINQPSD